MKISFYIKLIICVMLLPLCNASSDVDIPFTAKAIHFNSANQSFKVIFNSDKNKKNIFSSITIENKNLILLIPFNELNINNFSELDSVELLEIAEKKTMYIRIIDHIGVKGERREDRLYFSGNNYIKRVTLKSDENGKVEYFTKLKDEAELSGFK